MSDTSSPGPSVGTETGAAPERPKSPGKVARGVQTVAHGISDSKAGHTVAKGYDKAARTVGNRSNGNFQQRAADAQGSAKELRAKTEEAIAHVNVTFDDLIEQLAAAGLDAPLLKGRQAAVHKAQNAARSAVKRGWGNAVAIFDNQAKLAKQAGDTF